MTNQIKEAYQYSIVSESILCDIIELSAANTTISLARFDNETTFKSPGDKFNKKVLTNNSLATRVHRYRRKKSTVLWVKQNEDIRETLRMVS